MNSSIFTMDIVAGGKLRKIVDDNITTTRQDANRAIGHVKRLGKQVTATVAEVGTVNAHLALKTGHGIVNQHAKAADAIAANRRWTAIGDRLKAQDVTRQAAQAARDRHMALKAMANNANVIHTPQQIDRQIAQRRG